MSSAPKKIEVTVEGAEPGSSVVYTVVKLNTEPAALILARLVKMIGGSVMALTALKDVSKPVAPDAAPGEPTPEDAARQVEQFKIIGDAVNDLVQRNDPVEVHKLWQDLLCGGYVYKGKTVVTTMNDFDELDDMFVVLGACVQLSFGGFVKKLLAKLKGLKTPTAVAEPAA